MVDLMGFNSDLMETRVDLMGFHGDFNYLTGFNCDSMGFNGRES